MKEAWVFGIIFSCYVFFSPTLSQDLESDSEFPCYSSLSSGNNTCDNCIQLNPVCAWCSDEEFPKSRCMNKKVLAELGCRDIVHPKGNFTLKSDLEFKDGTTKVNAIQLRPQRIQLFMRPREKRQFTLEYKQAANYPVDLYYVMDLSRSMIDDKAKLTELGDQLAKRMNEITENFLMGFGSFIDKPVVPLIDPRPEKANHPCGTCTAPYGFKHQLRVQSEASVFKNKVNASEIAGNLDAPEGGFDALMQAMMCEQIGWRNISRRIIVFSTDAGFHFAGDGRIAGIVKPNDGKCHLDRRSMYSESTEQDYPSIAQIHETMKKTETNIIFAVTGDQVPTYKLLEKALPDVNVDVGPLANDSSNIVSLIEQSYLKISQKIQLVDNASSNFAVTYRTKCLGSDWTESRSCDDVKIGEAVKFEITVEALRCPEPGEELKEVIRVGPAGLNEELVLDITVLCQCPCSKKGHPDLQPASAKCNGRGTRKCGVCACDSLYSGRKCECKSGQDTGDLDKNCRKTANAEICENRGECNCGLCECDPQRGNYTGVGGITVLKKVEGTYCECDNFNCPRHNRKICNAQGECKCGKCKCNEGWGGRACECPTSTDSCRTPNGEICNGRGECVCGVCHCRTETAEDRRYSGPKCDICTTCKTKCEEYRKCVMCKHFGTGPLSTEECNDPELCPFTIYHEDKNEDGNLILVKHIDDYKNLTDANCQSVDPADDCTFYYGYAMNGTNATLWVKKEKECPPPVPVLAIILGVIAGIVLIGLILLLVWKLLTVLHDKREFAMFEKDRLNARWDTGENPIFHPATTTFKNPAYGGRS